MHGHTKKKRASGEVMLRSKNTRRLCKAVHNKLGKKDDLTTIVDALFVGAVKGRIGHLQLLIQLAENAGPMEELVTQHGVESLAKKWASEEEWTDEVVKEQA